MNWLKGKKEDYAPFELVNEKKSKYYIKLSPKPFSPVEEGDDSNVQYLSVVHIGGIPTTYDLKQMLINLQKEYDNSDEVNCFIIDGEKAWADKATRVGLINSCNTYEVKNKPLYPLWINGKVHNLPPAVIKAFLLDLEDYAIDCYNVKEQHLAEISALTTRDAILNYDVSNGYPEKIVLDTTQLNGSTE